MGTCPCPGRNLEEKRLLWRLLDIPGAPGQGGEAVPALLGGYGAGEQGPGSAPTEQPPPKKKPLCCCPQAAAGSRLAGSPSVGPASPAPWLPSSAARAARCRASRWSWRAPGTACRWSRRGLLQVRLEGARGCRVPSPRPWGGAGSCPHPLWPQGAQGPFLGVHGLLSFFFRVHGFLSLGCMSSLSQGGQGPFPAPWGAWGPFPRVHRVPSLLPMALGCMGSPPYHPKLHTPLTGRCPSAMPSPGRVRVTQFRASMEPWPLGDDLPHASHVPSILAAPPHRLSSAGIYLAGS